MNPIRGNWRKVVEAYGQAGPSGVLTRSVRYFKHHLVERRRTRRFTFSLERPVEIRPARVPVAVRLFSAADQREIEAEFYPAMAASTPDKLLFDAGLAAYRTCFVATMAGSIVHYSWVHTGGEYPSTIRLVAGEALIGPCFTLPRARGAGLYPHVLSAICADLQERGYRRVFIETDRRNRASLRGIEKAGFRRANA